jgi:hypothetical protein
MTTSPPELPPGWDLERIQAESGESNARLLDAHDRLVVIDPRPVFDDYVTLDPVVIIDVGGLCLLQVSDDTGWYMGQLHQDGSIVCWASYGDDLGEAIRAL